MKTHVKFALTVCAVAMVSLLGAQAATVQVQVVQVGQGGLKFVPQNVTINVGDSVEWTWVGAIAHSTTSGTPGSPDGMWDSGLHIEPFTFSVTFTTVGTFSYFCTAHGLCCGMIGSVTVNQTIDTVTITRAQYSTQRSQLTVQATDSDPTATLTVSVTSSGQVLGTMTNQGGGNYNFKKVVTPNPRQITVTSNLGGTATARVRAR
jgi:plastocyanin